jgi:hypothetical protein
MVFGESESQWMYTLRCFNCRHGVAPFTPAPTHISNMALALISARQALLSEHLYELC